MNTGFIGVLAWIKCTYNEVYTWINYTNAPSVDTRNTDIFVIPKWVGEQ